ncbi:MAG: sugar transferase [Chloroflexaceae bacterium]|jgi:exopolysaccharide biosynthesis polyprenyl glycosylphosphotransferase|nr:sugar transferase [Chloroflexaceae bacterium]
MDRSLHPAVRPTLEGPSSKTTGRRSRWGVHLATLVWDQLLVVAGFALAYWMRYVAVWPPAFKPIFTEVATDNFVTFAAFFPITLLLVLLLAVQFEMKGLYRLPRWAGLFDHASIIVSSTLTGIALLIVAVFLYRPFYYSRLIFPLAGINIVLLLCTWRLIWIASRHWLWSRGIGQQRVLVLGGTGLGQEVMNTIAARPGLGYNLVGYLDERPLLQSERETRIYHYAGGLEAFESVVGERKVDQVIIALPFWEQGRLPELVETCRRLGLEYHIAPDLYQLSFDKVDVLQISGVPLVTPKEVSLQGWNLVLKRMMDVALVILSLPLTLPLGLLLAWLIRRDSPGPALFQQERVGKHGKAFLCYKFRTMVVDAEERKAELAALNEADGPLFKMKNDPRITRVGGWLRRSSLDELPQLLNVLRGEMSLVGPRPPLPAEVAQYEHWHHRRLEVLPGLTGLGQALGRSDISFDELVRLDIYYAENWSVGMDVRIMVMTIPAVLGGRGAY